MTMNAKWEFSRRDALLVAAGGVAAALTAPGAARADTATVSGLVFEDKDGSGKPGPGNSGLAGVLVSNGKDIAVTDADGRYTLPLPEEAVIFVIKPAGFMPPVDPATNLPRFYRLHQPDGSPASLNLTFAGVPPTGPLPPRSISCCGGWTSRPRSRSCCSRIRSPNRT
jgi:N terminal of Calcineurin-like phosphoesterase